MSKYPNSGLLAVNDRKTTPNHPDYSGQCEIDGVAYWISGWKKQGAKGPFLSLSFKPKAELGVGQGNANQVKQARQGSFANELNDDIPFAPEWR